MGDTRNNMSTSDKSSGNKLKDMAKRVVGRGGKSKSKVDDIDLRKEAETLADYVVKSDEKIQKLIDTKKEDLKTEGRTARAYNEQAVELLEEMQEKFDEIADLMVAYQELKH